MSYEVVLVSQRLSMAGSIVRIQKEYKEVREAKDNSGVTADLVDNNFTHWKGTIKGPVRQQHNTTNEVTKDASSWPICSHADSIIPLHV